MVHWTCFEPEPGVSLVLAASERGLCRLSFDGGGQGVRDDKHPVLKSAMEQLTRYFRGESREFSVPLNLRGTPFQMAVWQALLRIPYGETRSYAEIAAQIGNPKAARAVGHANGSNPVAIIVPCHRVIASGGGLGGYGGGLDLKRRLLELEATVTVSAGAPGKSGLRSTAAVVPEILAPRLF